MLNGLHLDARARNLYLDLFDYWKKIFAVAFGMGVVSGIVMSYQFGTNWSVYSDKVGPVIGPLMGYEVLSAFFLEAGFLGVMLFGRERVGPKLHAFAALMVAIGTFISTFWIWRPTPGCRRPRATRSTPTDNFADELVAGDLQSVVPLSARPHGAGGLSDHGLRRRRRRRAASAARSRQRRRAADVLDGDGDGDSRRPDPDRGRRRHGLNTLKYQPAKIAAMEGDFETRAPAPMILFGLPT